MEKPLSSALCLPHLRTIDRRFTHNVVTGTLLVPRIVVPRLIASMGWRGSVGRRMECVSEGCEGSRSNSSVSLCLLVSLSLLGRLNLL